MPSADQPLRAFISLLLSGAAAVGVSSAGCATRQADIASASAATSAGRSSIPADSHAKVQTFRRSIADRQQLMNRTGAEEPASAVLTAAQRFYAEHGALLRSAFDSSVQQLPKAPRPSAPRTRLVATIDVSVSEDPDQLQSMARFQLAIAPDVRERAKRTINQFLVALLEEQGLMPLARAGAWQVFFSVAEPSYALCGERAICVAYGTSDTFVVRFEPVADELWVEDQLAWWTTAPVEENRTSDADEPASKPPAPPSAGELEPADSAGSATTARRPDEPIVLGDEEKLRTGLVEFGGMVRPTKGGISIRAVTFAVEHLAAALPGSPSLDAMLGDRIRIVAELDVRKREASSEGPMVQDRAGRWFFPVRLVSAAVVDEAVIIEDDARPSKGFYSVGGHLVQRQDLVRALGGRAPDDQRVRLWGQPRTVRCEPGAQCLTTGYLPLFDIGRAEFVE